LNGNQAILFWIVLGFAPFLVGCRKGTTLDRLPVRGKVTLPSGELLNGSITFLPAKGRSGPAANTAVTEGKYGFDRYNGPVAGAHVVMVRRIEPRSGRAPSAGELAAPPKKSEWTLSAELSDDGQYLQDFELD
jgi:hypothetical protein